MAFPYALEIIFQNCLRSGKFNSEWEKTNVVPTFKKGDKQRIKNCRRVSLIILFWGKVFERLLYDNMFSPFFRKRLISPKQSEFRPGQSCTNQFLSIAHEILSAFDGGHKGVFFSINLKRLINFGMKVCFSSYNKTGYRGSWLL